MPVAARSPDLMDLTTSGFDSAEWHEQDILSPSMYFLSQRTLLSSSKGRPAKLPSALNRHNHQSSGIHFVRHSRLDVFTLPEYVESR